VARLSREYGVERLIAGWASQRPYTGPAGEPLGDYAAYRRRRLRAHLDGALRELPPDLRATFDERLAERRQRDLPAYQRQLTILTTLYADSYQDRRTPLPAHLVRVALL